MQVYTKSRWSSLKMLLFFALTVFIAFLPVSSFLFFIKNDAFSGYFPPKFFMSESIASGHIPLWNPYINFGFPQYGDMSGGYWSPITWLIASTIGYNAYTFTAELLMYLFIGGIGMYKLTGLWSVQKNIRIIAAVVFICCGYHAGHLQHFNWLSGSAFLPCCLWAYLLMQQKPGFKTALLNVFFFYLLLSSAHPGISIGAVYFFIIVSIFSFIKTYKNKETGINFSKKVSAHFYFILLLGLVSAGMIAGYADIIPHFVRGEKNSFLTDPSHASSFQSWISILFPLSIVKNESFFVSDLSLRDSYFSLTLLIFFTGSLFMKKTSWQKLFLFTGIFFFLISAGGIIQKTMFGILPVLGYVRLIGEFRIFAILCFILVAVIELDKFFREKKAGDPIYKKLANFIQIISVLAFIVSLYFILLKKESFIYTTNNITNAGSLTGSIKALIDHCSFFDCLFIHSIIQFVIITFIKKAILNYNSNFLLKIVVADMVLSALLVIPFTGAGKASLQQVQTVLNESPSGIPVPPLQSIYKNTVLPANQNELIGSWSMFSKEIGTITQVPYPIQLNNSKLFFEDSLAQSNYFKHPFIYIETTEGQSTLKIKSFTPNNIHLETDTLVNNTKLILLQNYYPHWKAYINGNAVKINKEGNSFMNIELSKGKNEVQFSFQPEKVEYSMLFSLIVFITIIIMLAYFFAKSKPTSLSSPVK